MVRQDAETVFQQIKELGMTGKGWVWIGTDGATSSTFHHQKDLERTMEGMIGTQPKNGEGSIYLNFLAAWLKKDSTIYPGIVRSKPVSFSSAYINIWYSSTLVAQHKNHVYIGVSSLELHWNHYNKSAFYLQYGEK